MCTSIIPPGVRHPSFFYQRTKKLQFWKPCFESKFSPWRYFSKDPNKWYSDSGRSGLYDGFNENFLPFSVNFFRAIKKMCSISLYNFFEYICKHKQIFSYSNKDYYYQSFCDISCVFGTSNFFVVSTFPKCIDIVLNSRFILAGMFWLSL